MKAVLVSAAFAALVAAQDLPACGSLCIGNMQNIMQQSPYGCSNNPTCFCCKPDFGFGVRDCANQACLNAEQANSVISYAASYCASALPTESVGVCTSFSGIGATGSVPSTSPATSTGSAASSMMTEASSSGAAASGAMGGNFGAFGVPVASGASGYSIAGTTITPGGSEATTAATAYTVASNGDVIATASGVTTTYASSAIESEYAGAGGAGASSSGAAASSGAVASSSASASEAASSSGAGAGSSSHSATSTSTTSTSSGMAHMITAAPAVMGAAALALMAL